MNCSKLYIPPVLFRSSTKTKQMRLMIVFKVASSDWPDLDCSNRERRGITTKVVSLPLREGAETEIRPDIMWYSREREDGVTVCACKCACPLFHRHRPHSERPPPTSSVCDLNQEAAAGVHLWILGVSIEMTTQSCFFGYLHSFWSIILKEQLNHLHLPLWKMNICKLLSVFSFCQFLKGFLSSH